MRIAIDGTCASGKSTIAKKLAEKLSINFFNTGMIYRTLTLLFLRNGIGTLYITAMKECLQENTVVVEFFNEDQHVFLNGQDITQNLSSSLVGANVASYSEIPDVRQFVRLIQRNFSQEHDVVMEGRDIGTEILPDADYKFFINADYYVRVDRRIQQLISKGETVNEEEVFDWLYKRDNKDITRIVSPLKIERDYKYIDTSDKSVEESVSEIINFIKEKGSDVGCIG